MSDITRGSTSHQHETTPRQGDVMTSLDAQRSRDVAEGPDSGRSTALGRLAMSRRRALGLTGSAVAVAGAASWAGKVLLPEQEAVAAAGPVNLYLAGTDGWIHLPESPAIPPFHPDPIGADVGPGLTTYIFGFRNVTEMSTTQRLQQKYKAQHSAPVFWVDQYDETEANEFRVQLTNLGLELRPDLFDAHTLHWHGFRNVIPFFDGEPSGSVSVPAGREFTYAYRPREAGTYMFHCHVEDVEHVHMGMTGMVFVRPKQNRTGNAAGAPIARVGGNTDPAAPMGYVYNDDVAPGAEGSTAYDREFSMFLSEVWAEAHWADAHIQLPEWSDYRADFALLNGRVYPDTVAPNGPGVNPFDVEEGRTFDTNGDLIAPDGHPELQFQPISSLVTCVAGERVALRFSNLGFRESAMTIAGLRMRVIGRDATPMRGRDGTDTSYETDTLNIGPGESYDVLFTAPNKVGTDPYDTYFLYNRSFSRSNNLEPDGGFGGQTTEIRVYAQGDAAAPANRPSRTTGGSRHDHHDQLRAPFTAARRRPHRRRSRGRRWDRGLVRHRRDRRRAPAQRDRLHDRRCRRSQWQPGLRPHDTDRLHRPARRQHRLHVGLLERVRRLPAPRPRPLRPRG